MAGRDQLCDALAALLAYPRADFPGAAAAAARTLLQACPEAGDALAPFLHFVRGQDAGELEEFYTRAFEVDPQCCLEVGWHLHGESYARGVFLVRMRSLLKELGLPEDSELPDHLTHVLRCVGRVHPEDAALMTREMVVPAIERMAVGLSANQNPYEGVLDTILLVLARSCALPEPAAEHE